jgi:hypothetical protein
MLLSGDELATCHPHMRPSARRAGKHMDPNAEFLSFAFLGWLLVMQRGRLRVTFRF